jgi:ribosome-associated protein
MANRRKPRASAKSAPRRARPNKPKREASLTSKRMQSLAPQRNGIASTRETIKALTDAEAEELARRCRAAALEKKAENVLMLDIRDRAAFSDYFILATGRSVIQARAIADGIVEANEMESGSPLRTEGYNDGSWILVDYGAVIVHVFTPQAREFYDLERLWSKPSPVRRKQG